MSLHRSFDVNKPGSDVEDLKGGVAGGSILKGNKTYSMTLFALPLLIKILLMGSQINILTHKLIYRCAQSWTRNRSQTRPCF